MIGIAARTGIGGRDRGVYHGVVRDDDCVGFLQWALPRLGMRWAGFRKVRSQVCTRIARRMGELGLADLGGYRRRLDLEPDEWRVLDRLCRVTISRLWRDRATFEGLGREVLPTLAERAKTAGRRTLDVWSCGCASGEEPHSLSMLWLERVRLRHPGVELRVLATDLDLHLLQRARRAVSPRGATRELPDDVAAAALEPAEGDELRVAARFREPVHLALHDVREGVPGGPFDLVLCRNLVFTYFEESRQVEVGRRLAEAIVPGGALVVGGHEAPPAGLGGLEPWPEAENVFLRTG